MRKSLITSVISSSILLTGCFSPDLPTCDSKEAQNLLADIFNDTFKKMRINATFEGAKKIREKDFNKNTQVRSCYAKVMASDGSESRIIYNIFWQNEKKGLFNVQIVGSDQSNQY